MRQGPSGILTFHEGLLLGIFNEYSYVAIQKNTIKWHME